MRATYGFPLNFSILSLSLVMAILEGARLINTFIFEASGLAVGWLLCVSYLLGLYGRDPALIASMFWQLLYFFSMMLSATLISLGFYMYEIKEFGFANGEFWILFIFLVVSCEFQSVGVSVSRRLSRRQVKFSPRVEVLVSSSLVIFVLGLCSYVLLRYGSPLSADVNRIKYWGEVAPAYLSFIRILVICTFYLAAYLFMRYKSGTVAKRFFLFAIVLYIIYAFIFFGEKFSLLVFYVFAWLVVTSAINAKFEVKRSLRRMVFIFGLLVINVGVVYEFMGLGFDFVVNRIPLEGQVLWGVLNERREIILCGFSCVEFSDWSFFNVRGFVDKRYLPSDTYLLNQISGTSLTGYFPSWQILAFGLPMSLVVHAAFSIVLGLVHGAISGRALSENILLSFLYFIAYVFLIALWYVGNFNLFPAIVIAFSLVVIFHVAATSHPSPLKSES